jgi:hypothetical protein
MLLQANFLYICGKIYYKKKLNCDSIFLLYITLHFVEMPYICKHICIINNFRKNLFQYQPHKKIML